MNEKKYKSVVVLWGIIFLCLQALSIINVVGLRPDDYTKIHKLIVSLVAAVMIGIVIIFMVLSLKKKKAGPIIGMILGAIYILSFSIINAIVGICYIISCADLLKDLNIDKKKNVEIKEKTENSEEQKESVEA